jgi:hypothetical protein
VPDDVVRPMSDPTMQATAADITEQLNIIKTRHDTTRREFLSLIAQELNSRIVAPATP